MPKHALPIRLPAICVAYAEREELGVKLPQSCTLAECFASLPLHKQYTYLTTVLGAMSFTVSMCNVIYHFTQVSFKFRIVKIAVVIKPKVLRGCTNQ
jgi:hypothetical protein